MPLVSCAIAITAFGPGLIFEADPFAEQLALAKKEGITTSFEQIKAQIAPVDEKDNAATIYTQIVEKKLLQNYSPIEVSPWKLESAKLKEFVEKNEETLELLDKASSKPACNFDRKYEQGLATFYKEAIDGKKGAQLLTMRAAYNASIGQHDAAVADFRKALQVARHLNNEPTEMPRLIANSTYTVTTNRIAKFAIAFANQSVYLSLLDEAVSKWPKRNPSLEFANELPSLLQLLENAGDRSYYTKAYGLPQSEISGDLLVGTPEELIQVKAEIVEAYREAYQTFKLKQEESDQKYFLSMFLIYARLNQHFPVAGSLYQSLTFTSFSTAYRHMGAVDALIYQAVHRAIQYNYPEKLDLSDLLIPYDNIPLEYSKAEDSITITAKIPSIISLPEENFRSLTLRIK